ncbi:hypothetical protein ACO1O0_005931 [Amphichorda felina]
MSLKDKTQALAACSVANLEGLKNIPLPNDILACSTLEGLQKRITLLETRYNIPILPPSPNCTWRHLAWRISQLESRQHRLLMPGGVPDRKLFKTSFGNIVPPSEEISIEELENIVSNLATRVISNSPPPPPSKEQADEEQRLDVVRQNAFYLAGRRRTCITSLPTSKDAAFWTKLGVYTLVVELTMDVPACSPIARPAPRQAPPPPSYLRGAPAMGTKRCGGKDYCTCTCNAGGKKKIVGGKASGESFFRFGWLKSLVCRRRAVVDDSSSISSGTTAD